MIDEGHFHRDTHTPELEQKEVAAAKPGWWALLLASINSKIPAGYEDESGFHFGADSGKVG
jgi:hypothetical protein